MTDTLLWSLEEAARQLGGISTRTVRRLLEVGEIEPRRVGRRLLVSAASVRFYVDRLGPGAQNPERAGRDVREESTCLESAKPTRMASMSALTLRATGRPTWTQAARELDGLLASKSQSKGGEKPRRS